MYTSRITGYQDPLSWTFSKVLLIPISELVILYQPYSKGSNLHQAPHVCVIPWVSSELIQGLLSFAHMIMHVIWLHFQWMQMSLRSLCLVSHDVSIYFMYRYCILDIILLELVFPLFLEGFASMMPLHLSYYFSSWTVVTCSSEQVSFFFACRWLCMRCFLQVKCRCMVRNIS